MGKKMTLRQADKQMQKIKAEFKKNHVVMKKTKAAMAKMNSAGRYISALPPESWLTAFALFVIYSQPTGGGKTKKILTKMVEGLHSGADVESLLVEVECCELQQMEYDEVEEGIFEGILHENESLIMDMIDLVDGFDSPIYTGRLTVRKLNEEVKRVKNGGTKAVRKEAPDAQLKIFFNLYSRFLEKLRDDFAITSPEKIEKFMIMMADRIQKIQIRKAAKPVSKPKARVAVPA